MANEKSESMPIPMKEKSKKDKSKKRKSEKDCPDPIQSQTANDTAIVNIDAIVAVGKTSGEGKERRKVCDAVSTEPSAGHAADGTNSGTIVGKKRKRQKEESKLEGKGSLKERRGKKKSREKAVLA